ncbi:MAG TPA: hypothetical protein DEO89_08420 [Lachnospiraceae bacterium]|nr:hypothetical protein [Lachnospiraceae bacterium]
MTTYKNTIRLFMRTLSVSIPYVLLLTAENVFLFRLLHAFVGAAPEEVQAIYFLKDMDYLYVLGFLFFLFISCEFMRKSREINLRETMRERAWLVEGNQFAVLGTAIVVYALVFLIYAVAGVTILRMPQMCFIQMLKILGVNIFLLSCAAAGMGYLISRIPNRYVGYLVILAVLMLILPANAKYFSMLSWGRGISVYWLRDWLYLLPPDIQALGDPLYGMPVEYYRNAGMLLWIGVGGWLFVRSVYRYAKGKRRVADGLFIVWTALCVLAVVNEGSVLRMTDHPKSAVSEDRNYYDSQPQIEEKQKDFRVQAYDMELSFGGELSAKVTATVSAADAPEQYPFTLYHGYKISDIRSEDGESLSFTQDGDQVVVDNPQKKAECKLMFCYKGSSPVFYANRNACFLPGFFAYYPVAGVEKLYENGMWKVNENETAAFTIHTKGLNAASNLPGNGDSHAGETSYVTLVGGNCRQMENDGNQQVIYPLDTNSFTAAEQFTTTEFSEEWEKLMTFLAIQEPSPAQGKMVVVIPGSFAFNTILQEYYDLGDHILTKNAVSPIQVLAAEVKAEGKTALKDIFFSYDWQIEDPAEIELLKDLSEGAELSEEEKLQDDLILKMRECGTKYVAQATIQYLMDTQDNRTPNEFLQALQNAEGGRHDKD